MPACRTRAFQLSAETIARLSRSLRAMAELVNRPVVFGIRNEPGAECAERGGEVAGTTNLGRCHGDGMAVRNSALQSGTIANRGIDAPSQG